MSVAAIKQLMQPHKVKLNPPPRLVNLNGVTPPPPISAGNPIQPLASGSRAKIPPQNALPPTRQQGGLPSGKKFDWQFVDSGTTSGIMAGTSGDIGLRLDVPLNFPKRRLYGMIYCLNSVFTIYASVKLFAHDELIGTIPFVIDNSAKVLLGTNPYSVSFFSSLVCDFQIASTMYATLKGGTNALTNFPFQVPPKNSVRVNFGPNSIPGSASYSSVQYYFYDYLYPVEINAAFDSIKINFDAPSSNACKVVFGCFSEAQENADNVSQINSPFIQ